MDKNTAMKAQTGDTKDNIKLIFFSEIVNIFCALNIYFATNEVPLSHQVSNGKKQ